MRGNTNTGLAMNSEWFVYILRTAGGALYTGITTDVSRRLDEHAGIGAGAKGAKGVKRKKGAKSLRGKGPLELVWHTAVKNRSEASVLEARIKKLSRNSKEQLVSGDRGVLENMFP